MPTKDRTYIAYGQGDATVGDGAFCASLTLGEMEDSVMPEIDGDVRDTLAKFLGDVWNLESRRVRVMTQEEFHVEQGYTAEDRPVAVVMTAHEWSTIAAMLVAREVKGSKVAGRLASKIDEQLSEGG